ncbi:MAG: sugar (pentulose or hexulose) kinase [Bacteroidia bacterium]|jgi:sugar (pentulose or hexulose) kinase
MAKKITLIFDVGKTNKKVFLFDNAFQVLHSEYVTIPEIVDEDGFPTEDLHALVVWMKEVLHRFLNDPAYVIEAINFSAYGASLVHLDEDGKVLTPIFNYLKPIDSETADLFYAKYGPQHQFSISTGSAPQGMLQSGMQLFWLKHTQPEIFQRVTYSLHLPQYFSYVLTKIPVSDYTSIGCHTALWDFSKNDYHSWVFETGIDKILAPIVPTNTVNNLIIKRQSIKVGVGIHDSSAALHSYFKIVKKPFVLVSTGTWSITMNPFLDQVLSNQDIQSGCIQYLQINGKPVRSSKLLLGKEYDYQIEYLMTSFQKTLGEIQTLKFNRDVFKQLSNNKNNGYRWKYLTVDEKLAQSNINLLNFEKAYHQLIMELVDFQVINIQTAIGMNTSIKTIYVDGGFADNVIFMSMLSLSLNEFDVIPSSLAHGSALGAAMVLEVIPKNFEY